MKIFGYIILILFSFLNGITLNAQVVTWGDPILPLLGSFYESTNGTTIEIDATPTYLYPVSYTYQWYYNRFPIPSIYGGTNSAYTIDGSESSNGTWRVEVTNDVGATSAEFEYRLFTDEDGDGLSDYRESNILSTDPNLSDTDGDGLNDYEEVITFLTDPNVADSDNDGLNDGDEISTYLSNPLTADTSGDGFNDGFIVGEGLNPTSDYSALRSSTISNVVSNSEAYGLYRLVNVIDVEAIFRILPGLTNNSSVISIQIKELKSYLDDIGNLYLRSDIFSDYVLLMDVINQTEGEAAFFDYITQGHQYDGTPNWIVNFRNEQIDSVHLMFITRDTDTKFFRFKMAE